MTTLAAPIDWDALMPEMAASKVDNRAELFWARSLRLRIYMHLVLLPPLWLARPLLLKILFGERFVPDRRFRWPARSRGCLESRLIVISGLPRLWLSGLSTLAKFWRAVTTVGLLVLFPRWGITGRYRLVDRLHRPCSSCTLRFVKKRRLVYGVFAPRWAEISGPIGDPVGFTFRETRRGRSIMKFSRILIAIELSSRAALALDMR